MKQTGTQTRWIAEVVRSAALLAVLFLGGCASVDPRNSSIQPWNRQTRWEVSKGWMWVNNPSNDDWNRTWLSRTYP